MKLYRVTYHHPHEGLCYEWYATARAGEAALKLIKDENADATWEYRLETEQVPGDQRYAKALCDWLNERFIRDNG
jgi:hypothetical protein